MGKTDQEDRSNPEMGNPEMGNSRAPVERLSRELKYQGTILKPDFTRIIWSIC